MRDHSTSSKAGNESSLQTVPPQQDKETAAATRQGQTTQAGAPIGFDFGKMPVFPPSRQNPNLPQDIQANMETSFGQDFSGVDIQRNSQQAQRLNALAYTQGESIHFAPGEFNPHSECGRNLIGHEFAHVVQQRSGVVQPTSVLGKGLALNDNQGLENEADNLGRKAVQGEAVGKYQSPSLGMRSGMRMVQAKSNVIQRDIKGSQDLNNGKMEIDFTKNDAAATGGSASESGTIKFTPNDKAPNSNDIKLIQIVRTIDVGGVTTTGGQSADYSKVGKGEEADRNKVMTSNDASKNIVGGFFVDHFASKANPRTNKSDATVSPYYMAYGPGKSGHKKSKTDIQPASLRDAPSSSAAIKFSFVTSAHGKDTGTWYGSVLWGFEIYLDKSIPKIKGEYKSFREDRGATTDAALEKFNEFYKNPGTSDAPTK